VDGGELRARRLALRLTQAELAARLGVTANTLARWERGAMAMRNPLLIGTALDGFTVGKIAPRLHGFAAQPTPLVGRETDSRQAVELLLSDGVRLVTLVGPAGTGKTRLGIAVATAASSAFADGTYFVDLSSVREPDFVVVAIAQALALRPRKAPLIETLRDALRDSAVLLLLDNFEQVAQARADLADLLAACPALRILVTSRERLVLRWEHVREVSSLDAGAARRLFLERAGAARAAFSPTPDELRTIDEITARLDRLPLAIELTAARVATLSLPAILSRLDQRRLGVASGGAIDAPARHRGLREALARSHELLTSAEQTLFRELAAFLGGCTAEAAAAMARPGEAAATMADLDSLARKSLVHLDLALDAEPRYTMLETVHEYALELLEASGTAGDARRRQAAYVLTLAERTESAMFGPDQIRWLARLEREADNVRAALRWYIDGGDAQGGLWLAGVLWPLWWERAACAEGRRWLGEMLALDPARAHTRARAQALSAAGLLANTHRDYDLARPLFEESLAIFTAIGDQRRASGQVNALAILAQFRGDLDTALALFRRGIEMCRATGDRPLEASMTTNVGTLYGEQRRLEEARAECARALAISREDGNEFGVSDALLLLGFLELDASDHVAAQRAFGEGLLLSRAVGDPRQQGFHLHGLAMAMLRANDRGAARTHAMAGADAFRTVADPLGMAQCLETLAAVTTLNGEARAALRSFGSADAVRETVGLFAARERSERDRYAQRARDLLSPRVAQDAWVKGHAMTLDQAFRGAAVTRVRDPIAGHGRRADRAGERDRPPCGRRHVQPGDRRPAGHRRKDR
jgi:predicted ATPase